MPQATGPITQEEEIRLLQSARRLEEEALTRVHNLYYRAIHRFIAFRVNDPGTAEDLASETFARLLTALRDNHAPRNTIRGWLYGTASNLVKDYYRQQKKRREVELTENIGRSGDFLGQLVDQQLSEERLYKALTELTEEQQKVLSLRFGSGLSIADTAELMNKSEGSVKMLQARAIAALSKNLGQVSK